MKNCSSRVICFLALALLVACDSANTQSAATASAPPAALPQAMPCVTATPLASGAAQAITTSVGAAQRTTPGAGQTPPAPAELATREAQLENQNRPVALPTGAGNVPALPVCPTTPPQK